MGFVAYLLGNCVPGESEASPNVDINVFTKTPILEIKRIFFFFFFFSTTYNIFYIKSLKVSTRSNEHELTQEHSLSFINFYLHFFIWLNMFHLLFLSCLQLSFVNLLIFPQIQLYFMPRITSNIQKQAWGQKK